MSGVHGVDDLQLKQLQWGKSVMSSRTEKIGLFIWSAGCTIPFWVEGRRLQNKDPAE